MSNELFFLDRENVLKLFKNPFISLKFNSLWDECYKDIRETVDEILSFATTQSDGFTKSLNAAEVAALFREELCLSIAKEAINMVFTQDSPSYDVFYNIITLITKENFHNAIIGKTMCDAVESAIREIDVNTSDDYRMQGQIVVDILHKFLLKC